MLILDTTLERTEPPPLEQRGDVMDARHDLVGLFGASADHRDTVGIACIRKSSVASPAIGMNGRARLDRLPDEWPQALRGDVLDAAQSDAPDSVTPFLGRHDDDSLLRGLPASRTLFRATHSGLVDLDVASEPLPLWPHHGPAQRVQPGPGRLVAAQAQHSLQAQGAHPILLAGDEPHRQHPHPQRLAGVLEHRTGRQRRAAVASPASKHAAHRHPRLPSHPTTLTPESVRPAHAADIVAALGLGPKPVVHFIERARVIDARGRACMFHGKKISTSPMCVKGIPINAKSIDVIPVSILTPETFQASDVHPTMVRFGATGTEAAPV